ncbi:T6SS immunity protein Tdi1 domain-containing protein [Arthrobacter sp. R-11]|uniref:T6SS immunity protein Tdi1 domain-containing protein n=1 Tax=Arthrobacter sp. R-11 TaxID=3404053 RepID=UPI003CF69C45
MFERFRAVYGPLRDTPKAGAVWEDERLVQVEGYAEFAAEFSGASFGNGLYRVHDDRSGPLAFTLIANEFPDFASRVCPVGYDWLGRQFAVDSGRLTAGQPQILLLEPGTGEALEIPVPFTGLHEEELIEYPDAALASDFFDVWSAANAGALPLRRDQCVGYRVPLFLGGGDVVENLEVSDMEVYWSICGQLRQGTSTLPPGTSINEIAGQSGWQQ